MIVRELVAELLKHDLGAEVQIVYEGFAVRPIEEVRASRIDDPLSVACDTVLICAEDP